MSPKDENNKILDDCLKDLNSSFVLRMIDKIPLIMGAVCLIFIGIFIGMFIGIGKMQNEVKIIKAEAINKGYAEWEIDKETGITTFKFKQNNIELPTNK